MTTDNGPRRPWVVGVTGASGTPYAAAVLRGLLDAGEDVDLVLSQAARLTLLDETGHTVRDKHWQADVGAWIGRDVSRVRYWTAGDMAAGPASGSYRTKGMVVVPATTASVAGIATGTNKNLLQRAADVTLKERRRLILVLRETPLRLSTLDNLRALAVEGAIIMPASPGFYAGANDIDQLVDFLAGRVLDLCDVEHDLYQRWAGTLGAARSRQPDPGRDDDGGGEFDLADSDTAYLAPRAR
ncbi:UbiX family flavin prenyltransferase [Saccharopolyspora sp. K220]|uniref:UbiX family flavin prenyltransferase n=1 Tax=Saccharopolyspora soli TaxID=2926618 RepID=UPI001F573C7F|nr:UbiX family flavin prenyltransferase [Saccharopolyspora soli]MCI2415893.1 UbiX family flavin prenyltransferase [Saccharopolyspora soli]